jgi:hypothetical protein
MDGRDRKESIALNEEPIALNEIAFRSANEALSRHFSRPGERGLDPYPFLCECGDRSCTRVIEVPLKVYAETRNHPTWFLVLPGHADPTFETIVEEAEGYEIIEKHGSAGDVARRLWLKQNG